MIKPLIVAAILAALAWNSSAPVAATFNQRAAAIEAAAR